MAADQFIAEMTEARQAIDTALRWTLESTSPIGMSDDRERFRKALENARDEILMAAGRAVTK
jgi:hypothetical protein